MSIQSGINQNLSIIGALATQTPGYAAKKEEKLKQTQIEGLESKLAGYQESLEELDMEQPEAEAAKESLEAGEQSVRKDLFKLDPSASRILSYYQELAIKRQEANDQAQGEKANRQEQKQIILTNVNKWGEINGK